MLICHCRAVNDRTIRQAALDLGTTDAEHLRDLCGAGARCGACLPALQMLLDELTGDRLDEQAAVA